MSTSTTGIPTLRHGEFFGRTQRKITAGEFEVADTRADPTLVVERHTHDNAHFILVLNGHYITAALDVSPFVVAPPALLLYNPPGTTHADRFHTVAGRCEGRFLSISFPSSLAELRTPHAPLLDDAVRLSELAAVDSALRLVHECRKVSDDTSLVVEGLCLDMLSRAARAQRGSGHRPSWLRSALEMLRDDYPEQLSVRAIARVCGVHPVYLARAFRRHIGCSPGEYRRQTRLERAAALISRTRSTLAEVALESGFADQSHMTRQFRRAYRLSPTEFRRRGL
ncbi:MAG: helix-turn-helix domain-containing protein [Gemmatimonadaceae bacterium]